MAEARRRGRAAGGRDGALAWALLAPSLLLFAVWAFYPLVRTVQLGFYRQVITSRCGR